jgi:hypothetical protein
MKRIIKLLLVLAVTVVNVKVKARSVELPNNCRNTKRECTIYAEKQIEKLATQSAQIVISRGATVTRTKEQQIKLIRGLIRVSSNSLQHLQGQSGSQKAHFTTNVHTIYGDIELSDGDVLIEASDSIVKLTNLSSGNMMYHPRGEDRAHHLPKGFATYLAKVTSSGVAEAGYPHPAEVDMLVARMARVYSRSEKAQLRNDLEQFRTAWREATRIVGPWYLDTVKREIASELEEKERQARLRAAREAEDRKLREMFQQRIFDP